MAYEKQILPINLLETFDSIIDLLEEGAPVDIFYFDRGPHNRHIYKLKCLGIYGNLLDAIKRLPYCQILKGFC